MSGGRAKALNIEQLTFRYQKDTPTIIDIPKWQVDAGDKIFVSGQSGSGKSTLLNLICGTLTPTSGTITLLEKPFSSLSSAKRDEFRAQHIGVVFQQFNLIPYLSVRQNVELAAYFGKGVSKESRELLRNNMSMLQLSEQLLEQRADQLSVGQQQRVAILRALINQPEIIIADEPTSALDSQAQAGFIQLLLDSVRQTQCTLVFVSHDIGLAQHFEKHIRLDQILNSEPSHVA
ncbi:ABC transporter ATP-binding protein [Aliiglaciecola litoralis]|uniref:ABC transporter ATP-binding protein n=1 Tax=Aliiglaciecola litoralis TaxID=582857 RepID=A0ABN1LD15_9ALTE